jgi:hypothetical protein
MAAAAIRQHQLAETFQVLRRDDQGSARFGDALLRPIPKGLNHSAQGWEERPTLGMDEKTTTL